MPIFSIIIPTYNPNKVLFEKCINSILSQSFNDYEILIVVNNAKKDTIDYINNLSLKDIRIKVLFSKLGGISNARNYGLKEACGNYIIFVDDDDELLDIGYLELSFLSFDNNFNDLIIFDYSEKSNYKNNEDSCCINITHKDLNDSFFSNNNKYGMEIRSVWAKSFRASIIKKNDILFDPIIKSGGEDALFVLEYAKHAMNAVFYKKEVYYHRLYDNSTTFRFNPKSGFEYNHFISKYINITSDIENGKDRSYFIFCDQIFYNIIITYICHKENTCGILKRSKELKRICKLPYIKQSIKMSHIKSMLTTKKKIALFMLKTHLYFSLICLLDKRYRS